MDHSTTVATPVAAKTRPSSFKRVVATALTAALAAGGLSVVAAAAPASAVETGTVTGGTFSWKVSDQVKRHLSTQTPSDDATIDQTTGIVTWVDGTGKVNTTTGASDVSYNGSANFKFLNPGTGAAVYSITVSDPQIVTTAAGAGTIKADVTWVLNASSSTAETTGTTNDVVVTTFTAGDSSTDTWTGTDALTITDTPDWAGVIAPGSADATEIGVGNADQPIDGKAFAKSFIVALTPGLRSHFYASGTNAAPTASNVYKAPSPFTATADIVAKPTVTPTITSQTHDGGYVVSVAGDGFRHTTSAGDMGVYVAIAPSGGQPGSDSDDADQYVTTKYAFQYGAESPGGLTTGFVNGTFLTTLTAPSVKLDPNVDYSIYTWQAHTHSNTSQDTETPLDIDFDALERYTSTVTATAPSTVAFGSPATVSVAITGADTTATGSVEFFNGETSVKSADLVNGVASIEVPDLAVGTYSFSAKYSGDDHFAAGTSAVAPVTVERAQAGSVTLALTRTSAFYGQPVNAMATVVGGTGVVAITVDDKQVGTATLTTAGVATVRLPASLLVGAHTITASYAGNETVGPKDSAPITLRIVKASTAKVTVSGAKYKKNTAPSVTVKVAKLNNGGWAHGTVKVYVGSKVVKTVKITTANKGTITVKLPKQTKSSIPVKAAYSGTTTINAKNSATVRIKRK